MKKNLGFLGSNALCLKALPRIFFKGSIFEDIQFDTLKTSEITELFDFVKEIGMKLEVINAKIVFTLVYYFYIGIEHNVNQLMVQFLS